MFRFWGREVMGWLLVLIGLFFISVATLLMLTPSPGPEAIFEGPPIGLFGIMIFRGGIHLLKVAVAARICMQSRVDLRSPLKMDKRDKKAESPWDW